MSDSAPATTADAADALPDVEVRADPAWAGVVSSPSASTAW
jgi:hypothetical protein